MTFLQFETENGQPVELYEFFQAGTFTRVTNSSVERSIGSNVFTPLAGLDRTPPTRNEELRSGECFVNCPHTFSIAKQFRRTLPSSLPALTVFRLHRNDPDLQTATAWKGEVVSCKFGDNTATLTCHPITRLFDKQIPVRMFAGTCEWDLYARGCKVNRAAYTRATTIATVAADGQTLTINNLRTQAEDIDTTQGLSLTADELDNFWNRGIIGLTGAVSERRSVVETNIGANPNVVRINRPFVESQLAGAAIEVAAGCNLDIAQDCNRKFQNAINFGGFHTMPRNNPFQIELDGQQNTANVQATVNSLRSFFGR